MAYSDYRVFVLAPTQPNASYAGAPAEDLAAEMREMKRNCSLDIRSQAGGVQVYPDPLFTGRQEEHTANLGTCFNELGGLAPQSKVTFIVTGHGSSGANGKVGMGYDDDEHFNYRVDAAQLAQLLVARNVRQLKKLDVCFEFRCCNSAYAPLPLREWQAKAEAKAIRDAQRVIADSSFIGRFYTEFEKAAKFSVGVIGFRGYFFPSAQAPKVAAKLDGKNQVDIKDARVVIRSNWEIPLDKTHLNKLLRLQNQELDEVR